MLWPHNALVTLVRGKSWASDGHRLSVTRVDSPQNPLSKVSSFTIAEALLFSAAVSLAVFSLQWRYGFNLGDEGWLWYISQRTALGDVPLRDFFSYDPGRYYWSAAIFKLLGRNGFYEQLLANYMFAIIGLAAAYFVMIRASLARGWRVAILLLLGVIIGFPRHKIYEQTLSLICVAAVAFVFAAPQRLRRWLVLGVMIGIAAFVGRNSGIFCAIAALVVFLVLRIRREGAPLLPVLGATAAGVLIGYSPIIVMLVAVPGFAGRFYQSVLLTPRWSWSLPVPFPWRVHLSGLHGLDRLQARAVSWLCIAVPAMYAYLLWRAVRSKTELENAEWLSVAASAAGAGFLLHAFYTSDFFHIAQGVVPFAVAAGARSFYLWRKSMRRWSLIVFCGSVFLILACWIPMEPLVQHLRIRHESPGKLVRIAIDGKSFEVPATQAALMNTVETAFRDCRARDGGFMVAPYYPGLYAFLNTRSPLWDTYFLWPRTDQEQQSYIESLERDRTGLILLNPEFAINGRESLELIHTNPQLVAYVTSHYQTSDVKLPGGFQLYYSSQECKVHPAGK